MLFITLMLDCLSVFNQICLKFEEERLEYEMWNVLDFRIQFGNSFLLSVFLSE
jgi:hypothetical protein